MNEAAQFGSANIFIFRGPFLCLFGILVRIIFIYILSAHNSYRSWPPDFNFNARCPPPENPSFSLRQAPDEGLNNLQENLVYMARRRCEQTFKALIETFSRLIKSDRTGNKKVRSRCFSASDDFEEQIPCLMPLRSAYEVCI